jgi:predicted N-acetyltransferase YhbS/1-acyl-sn-glycerol-3-phosphate acyltransferase
VLPPRLIRRLVLAPLVIILAVGFLVLSPFLAVLALVLGLMARARTRTGRMRSLRLVGFVLVWFVAETVALVMLAGLWVVSGFGGRLRTEPYQSRHYAVMRWFLDLMYRGAERTYGLRVEVDEPEFTDEERLARLARPVIVLSRHAGPGDSLLLVHQLLSVYQRRPRVVMKATLQLDPSVDIVGNRLPNVWIKHRQTGENIFTTQIERLARGLDQNGALVIFPEGGNWTPHRWRRGIRRLEHQGRSDLAARARDMPNLLPPRPGGALAAISACPEADVIFVAHAGLDNIVTLGDVWGKFPIDQVIRARWWRVPFDAVPRSADHEAKVQWLYDWWERIDTWISENRPSGATVPEVVELPEDETAEPVGELYAARRDQDEIRLRHPAAAVHRGRVLIRREAARDTGVIRAITAAAFARPGQPPGEIVPEATLVDELRASPAWLSALSLVAATPADEVLGHVLCTRGHVGQAPVLALGPLTVRPESQRRGVGSALMHAILGAADATGEPLVALLGDPAYYCRFGFQHSTDYQITPPKPQWQPHFQVRVLTSYQPRLRGTFAYPEPFDRT